MKQYGRRRVWRVCQLYANWKINMRTGTAAITYLSLIVVLKSDQLLTAVEDSL